MKSISSIKIFKNAIIGLLPSYSIKIQDRTNQRELKKTNFERSAGMGKYFEN